MTEPMADPTLRYRCRALATRAAEADPSLTVRWGWYTDPEWGTEEHWWCVDQAGEIVDPTAAQFPSNGSGVYTPMTDTPACEICGREVDHDQFVNVGPICGSDCYRAMVGV